ncbi:MAG TPA: acetoacetate decarboxylase family protein [Saprospiraceae bacterium]|nr:acetoacetate decarboxylase family protein [Saprospiraceae bacterium]HMP22996.1 acetoacetate decarboxylase family protein [Saprospiraceae bacterium]
MQLPPPAPWRLQGQGFILLYKFLSQIVDNEIITPSWLQKKRRLPWGFVMFVKYEDSPVGPYYELLLIPGWFRHDKGSAFAITKIYVSSEASVLGGRVNWGIPKELADFNWQANANGSTDIQVSVNEHKFLTTSIQASGWSFPVGTGLVRIPLVQELDGQGFRVRFRGQGRARRARVGTMQTDAGFFADLQAIQPLISLEISTFHLEFLQPALFPAETR